MTELVQKNDYLRFLDRNYCITSHVIERIEELENGLPVNFRNELRNTTGLLSNHLNKTEAHYKTVGATSSFADNEPLVAWLETLFSEIQGPDGSVSVIALMDYLSVADKLMDESAKLAQLACAQTPELPVIELYNPGLLRPVIGFLESQSVGV